MIFPSIVFLQKKQKVRSSRARRDEQKSNSKNSAGRRGEQSVNDLCQADLTSHICQVFSEGLTCGFNH